MWQLLITKAFLYPLEWELPYQSDPHVILEELYFWSTQHTCLQVNDLLIRSMDLSLVLVYARCDHSDKNVSIQLLQINEVFSDIPCQIAECWFRARETNEHVIRHFATACILSLESAGCPWIVGERHPFTEISLQNWAAILTEVGNDGNGLNWWFLRKTNKDNRSLDVRHQGLLHSYAWKSKNISHWFLW